MQIGSRGFSEEKHLIFCLDCSGSMKGRRWEKVERAIIELLALPEMKNIRIRNSITTFNDSSEIIEEFKNANEIKIKSINYRSGLTNFDAPLQTSLDLIKQHEMPW